MSARTDQLLASVNDVVAHVMAPGKKTSEFAGGVFVSLLHVLTVGLATFQPGHTFHLTPAGQALVYAEAGVVVPAFWTYYSQGRKGLKRAALAVIGPAFRVFESSSVQVSPAVTQLERIGDSLAPLLPAPPPPYDQSQGNVEPSQPPAEAPPAPVAADLPPPPPEAAPAPAAAPSEPAGPSLQDMPPPVGPGVQPQPPPPPAVQPAPAPAPTPAPEPQPAPASAPPNTVSGPTATTLTDAAGNVVGQLVNGQFVPSGVVTTQ